MKRVTVFAPATIGNVAVGFDILGCSLDDIGDQVTVEKTPERFVTLGEIRGVVDELPREPSRNTATAGLMKLIEDLDLPFGFRVSVRKGIPLGSGMGGSAASAVGAVVGANALLEKPLPKEKLLRYALIGEKVASGACHADNIAPCLFGGLTLATLRDTKRASPGDVPEVDVLALPIPEGISCVLLHPHVRVDTKEARKILKKDVSLHDYVTQSSNLARFLAGCYRGDLELIRHSLSDILIEPQRAHLIPGFEAIQQTALEEGALGCSISGSGPSIFAWAAGAREATAIQMAMLKALERAKVKGDSWVIPLPSPGARVIS